MFIQQNLPDLILPRTKIQWVGSAWLPKVGYICNFLLSRAGDLCSRLTALPLWMAQFQVLAGSSWILAGAVRAADALNLVIE